MLETAQSKELLVEEQRTAIFNIAKYKAIVTEVDVIDVHANAGKGRTISATVPLIVVDKKLWVAVGPLSKALKMNTSSWLLKAVDQNGERLLKFRINLGIKASSGSISNYDGYLYIRAMDIQFIIESTDDQNINRLMVALENKLFPIVRKLATQEIIDSNPVLTRSVGSRHSSPKLKRMYDDAVEREKKAKEQAKQAKKPQQTEEKPAKFVMPKIKVGEGTLAEPSTLTDDHKKAIDELETIALENANNIQVLTDAVNNMANSIRRLTSGNPEESVLSITDIPGHPNTITLTLDQLKSLIRV